MDQLSRNRRRWRNRLVTGVPKNEASESLPRPAPASPPHFNSDEHSSSRFVAGWFKSALFESSGSSLVYTNDFSSFIGLPPIGSKSVFAGSPFDYLKARKARE
jgi:hypothetical protein